MPWEDCRVSADASRGAGKGRRGEAPHRPAGSRKGRFAPRRVREGYPGCREGSFCSPEGPQKVPGVQEGVVLLPGRSAKGARGAGKAVLLPEASADGTRGAGKAVLLPGRCAEGCRGAGMAVLLPGRSPLSACRATCEGKTPRPVGLQGDRSAGKGSGITGWGTKRTGGMCPGRRATNGSEQKKDDCGPNAPSVILMKWRYGDSNPGPPACKAGALPTELYPRTQKK